MTIATKDALVARLVGARLVAGSDPRATAAQCFKCRIDCIPYCSPSASLGPGQPVGEAARLGADACADAR